eukprot:gene4840-6785_t
MINIILKFIIAVELCKFTVFSNLLLDETFQSLSNWEKDLDGFTAKISLTGERNGTKSYNFLRSNVTYCTTQDYCYRAEIRTPTTGPLRKLYFPSISTEYWLGFSNRIPNWKYYPMKKLNLVTYIFQIHGGDNQGNPPNFGLRVENNRFTACVCANAEQSSPNYTCNYFDLGKAVSNEWIDWVIHSKLAIGVRQKKSNILSSDIGFVEIWRNGNLTLNATNIPTAYNDVSVPYMKLGTYNLNWKLHQKTIFNITGVDYKRLKFGHDSSYDEVDTGYDQTTRSTKSSVTSYDKLIYGGNIKHDISASGFDQPKTLQLPLIMMNATHSGSIQTEEGVETNSEQAIDSIVITHMEIISQNNPSKSFHKPSLHEYRNSDAERGSIVFVATANPDDSFLNLAI